MGESMTLNETEKEKIKDEVKRIYDLLKQYNELLSIMNLTVMGSCLAQGYNSSNVLLSTFQTRGLSEEEQAIYLLTNHPTEIIMMGLHKDALINFIENTQNNIKKILAALNKEDFHTENVIHNANRLVSRAIEDCNVHKDYIIACSKHDAFSLFVNWVDSLFLSIERVFEDINDSLSILAKSILPEYSAAKAERDSVVKQKLTKNEKMLFFIPLPSYEDSIKEQCKELKKLTPQP